MRLSARTTVAAIAALVLVGCAQGTGPSPSADPSGSVAPTDAPTVGTAPTDTSPTIDAPFSVQGDAGGVLRVDGQEFSRFEALNKSYRERFGFPFILAVRGATKADILASFEERLGNSPDAEFERALDEIARIFRFRIEDRVAS